MATQKEKNKILAVLLILFVLLGGLFYVRFNRVKQLQEARDQTGRRVVQNINLPTQVPDNYATAIIRVTPKQSSVKVGGLTTLDVEITAKDRLIDGVDVNLRFDPGSVEVTDIRVGSYFSQIPRKTIDNVNGNIKVTGFNSSNVTPLLNRVKLFTIKLTGKKPGKTTISVDFDRGKTNKSNVVEHKTSRNILRSVENAVLVVEK